MPDIEVQITTLCRITLVKLRRALEDGDMAAIRDARQQFDALCDRLPRSETTMPAAQPHCRQLSRGHKCISPKGHAGEHKCFCGEKVDWSNHGPKAPK